MSTRNQIEKALRRAETRDKKRRPKMRVNGKGVFRLTTLMARSNTKTKR